MRSINRLDTKQPDFDDQLLGLTRWSESREAAVEERVAGIVQRIGAEGDTALLELTRELDRHQCATLADLTVSAEEIDCAWDACHPDQIEALEIAAARIREYHRHQVQKSWSYRDEFGNLLGQQITPLQRVGIYVPGGLAAYPSSVLMNAIPARVAGVDEIIMVTPTPDGRCVPMVLAAARIAGVDRIYRIGGAQAVAALALGTESISAVDKIVGPGNAYVAAAKRQLFGRVGIDMIAGPSEIMVVGDGSVDPDWIAMDLLSQAEHDEEAQSILVSWDEAYLDAVALSLERQLQTITRHAVARVSLACRGILVRCRNLDEAFELVNRLAPEHLELALVDAEQYLPRVRNAGAIFLGAYSPEAIGDYCAGPNHVLPTSATARFSSPLGVYDFQKRSSIIGCTREGAARLAPVASVLARGESLTAHAHSAEYRLPEGGERTSG